MKCIDFISHLYKHFFYSIGFAGNNPLDLHSSFDSLEKFNCTAETLKLTNNLKSQNQQNDQQNVYINVVNQPTVIENRKYCSAQNLTDSAAASADNTIARELEKQRKLSDWYYIKSNPAKQQQSSSPPPPLPPQHPSVKQTTSPFRPPLPPPSPLNSNGGNINTTTNTTTTTSFHANNKKLGKEKNYNLAVLKIKHQQQKPYFVRDDKYESRFKHKIEIGDRKKADIDELKQQNYNNIILNSRDSNQYGYGGGHHPNCIDGDCFCENSTKLNKKNVNEYVLEQNKQSLPSSSSLSSSQSHEKYIHKQIDDENVQIAHQQQKQQLRIIVKQKQNSNKTKQHQHRYGEVSSSSFENINVSSFLSTKMAITPEKHQHHKSTSNFDDNRKAVAASNAINNAIWIRENYLSSNSTVSGGIGSSSSDAVLLQTNLPLLPFRATAQSSTRGDENNMVSTIDFFFTFLQINVE